MTRFTLGVALALVVGLAGCVSERRPETCDEAEATIQITLTADAMTPNNPGVCRDQEVTLIITSETDGFLHIHGYDEEIPAVQVATDEDVEVDFVADRSGQFPIELHPSEDPEGIGIGVLTVYEP